MGYEELVRHLIRGAEDRRDVLLARAREDAGRLEADAREKAAAAEDAARESAAREADRMRRARMDGARREAREMRIRARAAAAEAILARLEERLEDLAASPRFDRVADGLILELLPEIPPGNIVVRADARTARRLGPLAADPRCRLEPLPEGEIGGLEVSDEDGRFLLRNTLRSRLAAARPVLAAEIGRRLPAPDE